MENVIIISPILGIPNTKALDDRTAPVVPFCHSPLIMITKAVMEHNIIVSINVPNIPIAPCFTGLFVLAAA